MKRTLAIIALSLSTVSGAAVAQDISSGDLEMIREYAPDADLSGLSDTQVASLLNIIGGSDTENRKRDKIQAMLSESSAPPEGSMEAPATNQAGVERIREYAPDADLTGITDTQVASLLSIIDGSDTENRKRDKVQAMLSESSAPPEGSMEAPATNQAGVDRIRKYAPDADLTGITDTQVASLLNIINGSDTENRKREKVRAMLEER